MQNTLHPKFDPNQQTLLEKGLLLPVMEMFYSIQGEGFNTGKPAAFVRIGGCDVGCYWCDVKESWDASVHPLTDVEIIVEHVCSFPSKAVVITGGEPLMYNLDELCLRLHKKNMTVFLESSGAYLLSGRFDWICVSPKSQNPPLDSMLALADELKVIIHDDSDFQWAEENSLKVREDCKLFLQPEWSQVKMMLPQIVDYVKKNPRWMVSLQSHKYMNIP
ncbi:MAG TPA: 7-carboxy-7-deazaguanine synthase QueE [Bacteroidales bacterium]|nr:7-carboxy-7-deazaguanine synthase QueE [Bacteroidales bacterium]